ncbi:MAG: HAMP domain-containing histidine kinase [Rickettsiales bacterium]|nr:HAMP domain-containing histidine kinase [Rickettsiales bacterium]
MFSLQIASLYIFFQRYWNSSSRKNLATLAKKIGVIDRKYNYCLAGFCNRETLLENINFSDDFRVRLLDKDSYSNGTVSLKSYGVKLLFLPSQLKRFESGLHRLVPDQVSFLRMDSDALVIDILKPNSVLEYRVSKNNIFIPRVNLLIFWNAISFLAIAAIAFIFVKNQVRSIKLLKDFANDFSYLEKENINFKPTGAREIREVGWAFLNVVRKMRNLMNARTTMLAQISHDLRTPLTRMKLQLEFMNDEEIAVPLRQDLEEMEKMINEYLLFAQGIVEGSHSLVDIRQFFSSIVDDYRRSNYKNIFLKFDMGGVDKVFLKIDSFRRSVNNIVNNSLKYRQKKIEISVRTNDSSLIIMIDDDGRGLEKDLLRKVRRPFYSTGKDSDGNNFGLGLSVVQHVVDMHRGKVYFGKSRTLGGLSVTMTIPILKKSE